MNWGRKVFMRLWVFYFYLVFAGIFFLLYPLLWFYLSDPKWYRKAHGLRILWAKILLPLIGIRYTVEYETPIDAGKCYIFCPNHTSYLDIPLMAVTYKGYFHFMAKAELQKIPLFGRFFKTMDIPVARGNTQAAGKALELAARDIENNVNLVIFPEGGISMRAPRLYPFKNGPFKLAIEKQIPVVPVTFLDNWKLFMGDDKNYGRPGKSRAIVHKPIDTGHLTMEDIGKLKEMTFEAIERPLKKEYGDWFSANE